MRKDAGKFTIANDSAPNKMCSHINIQEISRNSPIYWRWKKSKQKTGKQVSLTRTEQLRHREKNPGCERIRTPKLRPAGKS